MQRIEYISEWASPYFLSAEHDLASSGLPEKYLSVPEQSKDSEWRGRNGYETIDRLKAIIASMYGVPVNQTGLTIGASGALLSTALIMSQGRKPVVIESPVYEPVWRGYEALGIEIKWLKRRREEKYSLAQRIDEAKELTRDASCLVITNPNNPTGIYDGLSVVKQLAEAIHPAYLLINEAYLPCIDGSRSAYGLSENILIMQTMTKSYAVGMPRLGWIIAPPEFSNDLLAAGILTTGCFVATSAAYMIPIVENLESQRLQAKVHLADRHEFVYKAIREHPRIHWHEPHRDVIIGLIKIDGVEDDHAFCSRILDEKKIILGPGRYFREPGAIRFGFGATAEKFYNGFEIFLDYLGG